MQFHNLTVSAIMKHMEKRISRLSPKKRYLQIALNGTLDEAFGVIARLPISDRILVEAGTPLIKRYGEEGIRKIRLWYTQHIAGMPMLSGEQTMPTANTQLPSLISYFMEMKAHKDREKNFYREMTSYSQPHLISVAKQPTPYVVADLKMMDRGETEVEIAARGGADAAVALGRAPIESLNAFVEACEHLGLDAMIDMMNVEYPIAILREMKKLPRVVILHRGVDETEDNKQKMLPLYEIRRIKGAYDVMISIDGGDTLREVQSSFFNDADIAVVWKDFYHAHGNIASIAHDFLNEVK